MKSSKNYFLFYDQLSSMIDLNDYSGAIKYIKCNINIIKDDEDLALAYLNFGFLNNKIGLHHIAIQNFSDAIFYEDKINWINGRSKDIAYCGRSDSLYKTGDFKGAIDDKRKAKEIRLNEINQLTGLKENYIDYNNISKGQCDYRSFAPKYYSLIKISKIKKNKYDLIEDYKKVISNKRREEVVSKLEALSESTYKEGNFRSSIKAIRRAEKYY